MSWDKLKAIQSRTIFGAMALACLLGMLCAFYFQYVMGLAPCPLCMTQRVFLSLLGFIALAAVLANPKPLGVRIFAVFTALSAIGGAIVAGRQLWLQSLPADQVPACGPPLEYIVANFPLLDALQVLFAGDGNCAEVTWRLLGLSMPGWVLIIFIGLLVCSLYVVLAKTRRD